MASQRRPLTVDDSEDDILELDLIDLSKIIFPNRSAC